MMYPRKFREGLRAIAVLLLVLSLASTNAVCSEAAKDASAETAQANAELKKELPFQNKEDFELARKGFIAALEPPVIKNAEDRVVFDLTAYDFLDSDAPATANPSLWRQSQINKIHGLFEVAPRIYQVRGYCLSNITFIKGDKGWIVIDPLTTAEPAKAALDLINKHLGQRPVVAVIYTHSHADHFGGVRGVVDEADVKAGKVKIIAPAGFMEEAISENVMAGNAMARRASYMYGNAVTKGPRGSIGSGLGQTTSSGNLTLIEPTHIIEKTGTAITVDGLEIIFQDAPGAEAPAEMMFFFPQLKALCVAEIANCTMHNLYTLRGAKVRDALGWAKHINTAIEMFGKDTEVVFGPHHWPRWGHDKSSDYLKKQRDLYKYIHDQTLRLANHGYTMLEIAETMKLPESLAGKFFNRGYYGSLSHNAKAVYQMYLGWFDGNPANLHALPPEPAGRKYVEFMGGADAVLEKARQSFEKGEYRWVSQVVNHLVFADPENQTARHLQADALEQLGYQAESGPWRNFYLAAAKELRDGVQEVATPKTASLDVIKAMPMDLFLDFVAIRLNGPKAEGKTYQFNVVLTDTNEKYVLSLENSVLNYFKDRQEEKADATIHLNRSDLDEISLGRTTLAAQMDTGKVTLQGNAEAFKDFLAMLDTFDFWFNIVTP